MGKSLGHLNKANTNSPIFTRTHPATVDWELQLLASTCLFIRVKVERDSGERFPVFTGASENKMEKNKVTVRSNNYWFLHQHILRTRGLCQWLYRHTWRVWRAAWPGQAALGGWMQGPRGSVPLSFPYAPPYLGWWHGLGCTFHLLGFDGGGTSPPARLCDKSTLPPNPLVNLNLLGCPSWVFLSRKVLFQYNFLSVSPSIFSHQYRSRRWNGGKREIWSLSSKRENIVK